MDRIGNDVVAAAVVVVAVGEAIGRQYTPPPLFSTNIANGHLSLPA